MSLFHSFEVNFTLIIASYQISCSLSPSGDFSQDDNGTQVDILSLNYNNKPESSYLLFDS